MLLGTDVQILVGGHGTSLARRVAWMCALYAIAVWTDTRGFLAGIAVLVGRQRRSAPARRRGDLNDTGLFTVVPILAMVLVRGAVRGRQLRAEALAARAELLEREHELRAHEAVAEERARIARELHDLVAHNVSVMVVQAGAERHALRRRAGVDARGARPRSSRPAARRWPRRGGCSGCCAATATRDELEPQPGSSSSTCSSSRSQRAGLPVDADRRGRARCRCRPASTCARTGSSRRA